MTDLNDTYVEFLEAVVPDVNKELDRICMAVVELDLQNLARHKKTYKENAAKLRTALYRRPSRDAHGDSRWLYPGQHLCYWFDVWADYWKEVEPPATDATVGALENLLAAARHVQSLVVHEHKEIERARAEGKPYPDRDAPDDGPDPISARVKAAQKQTIDAVLAWHGPRKGKAKKAAKPSKRTKGSGKAKGRKAAKPASAGPAAGP